MLHPFTILDKTYEKDLSLIYKVLFKYNIKNNSDLFNHLEAQSEISTTGAFNNAVSSKNQQGGTSYHFDDNFGITLIIVSVDSLTQKPVISALSIINKISEEFSVKIHFFTPHFSKNHSGFISVYKNSEETCLFFDDNYLKNLNYYINKQTKYSKICLECITLIDIYHHDKNTLLNYILFGKEFSQDFLDNYKLIYDTTLNPAELKKYVSKINALLLN